MIGAVLLRYNGEAAMLESAVRSIFASDFGKAPEVDASVGSSTSHSTDAVFDIVIVDNASTVDPDAVDRVAALFPHTNSAGNRIVRTVRQPTNGGFATGVNRGIAALHQDCDLVLLLNDDARLGSMALAQLATTIRTASVDVMSVGPKIYLDQENGLLDSVGMAVNHRGEAKNVGLGQIDLGQFDGDTDSFGPCFGGALIRRSAFLPDNVGPLNEDFFMYYEDVEWNWRAQRLGYRSLVVPNARAWHRMSSSSRSAEGDGLAVSETAYSVKHRCIERNLLVTGATHLPVSDAVRLWAYRWPRLVKGIVTGRFPRASFMAAIDGARRLPGSLKQRRKISHRGKHSPGSPFRFWPPEPIYFDPVTYKAQRNWTALTAAARLSRFAALARACENNDIVAARAAANDLPPTYSARVLDYLARIDITDEPAKQ